MTSHRTDTDAYASRGAAPLTDNCWQVTGTPFTNLTSRQGRSGAAEVAQAAKAAEAADAAEARRTVLQMKQFRRMTHQARMRQGAWSSALAVLVTTGPVSALSLHWPQSRRTRCRDSLVGCEDVSEGAVRDHGFNVTPLGRGPLFFDVPIGGNGLTHK